ncbi:Phosphatidylinositol N-acetylglucosaminyltransferase subunit Q [Morus notabilis]|uniref:Phosphatidylinositol N-acetylglucosaminyltransferase subunit Q n=1 Tax=Morus notabilis TaxID=981085 RepID=W9RUK8_9ROSA|nr:Phosphatidylinositol N-acetylglucosaminyltransferase subunit Q [Morus notabilis]
MRMKCRVWWPKELSLTEPSHSKSFLFGWFVPSSSSSSANSLDVLVAFACSESSLSDSLPGLQGVLCETNEKMPVSLQEKSTLSLLGYYTADTDHRCNGELSQVRMEEGDEPTSSSCGNANALYGQDICGKSSGQWTCGCHILDRFSEKDKRIPIRNSWIQLVCCSHEKFGRDTFCIPKLHHIHWNGQIVSRCDVHFVLYETPTYGAHHFSLPFQNSSEQVKAPFKIPKWVEELQQKQPLCDMDTVILAINSATAARILFWRHLEPKRSSSWFFAFMWHLFAVSVALLSTILYVILQSLHKVLSYASSSWIYITLTNVFNTAGLNIQIRCSQILYWPFFLQDRGIRSLSCVEYAEKAALQRHFMWSSLAADVLLGNLFGLALLYHAESASSWVLNFADDVTNKGLKWNPLRQRFDSYEYTVKQHIVGSLLFTPLLLLLPTTSVFYIFFSILATTINLICILIGLTISVIHATPYIKIFLWFVRPGRFPSGIWFDVVSCQGDASDSSDNFDSPFENFRVKKVISREKSSLMVSVLHSNFMTLGEVVLPHYKNVFSGISRSSVAASAYGVLTGKRIYSGGQLSFTNAMDMHSLQRVLVAWPGFYSGLPKNMIVWSDCPTRLGLDWSVACLPEVLTSYPAWEVQKVSSIRDDRDIMFNDTVRGGVSTVSSWRHAPEQYLAGVAEEMPNNDSC